MKPASYLSARFLKTGLIDTVLVVIALALAGSVLAACISLMGAFDARLKTQVEAPWYKEIVVSLRNPNASSSTSPVTKLTTTGNRNQRLNASDLAASADASPLVSSSYIINFDELNVGVGGPGGGISITRQAPATGNSSGSSGNADMSVTSNVDSPGDVQTDTVVTGQTNGSAANSGQNLNAAANAAGESSASSNQTVQDLPPDFAQMEAAMAEMRSEAASLEQPLLTELQGARVTPGIFSAYGLELADGSLFTDDDMNNGTRVAVVGASLAKQLYSDGVALGKKIMLRGTTYTIIGVLQTTDLDWSRKGVSPNDIMYIPVDAGQFQIGRDTIAARGPGGPTSLRYAVANSSDLQNAKTQIQSWFVDKYGEENVTVSAPVEDLTSQRRQQDLVLGAIAALAGAGMLIAGINLFNLMTTRVLRRSRSIGILRSLGASQMHVFRQFLLEAGIMCAMGVVLAIAVAPFIFNLLAGFMSDDTKLLLDWPSLIGVSLLAGLVALAAALAPANQASRTVVVDAIRS